MLALVEFYNNEQEVTFEINETLSTLCVETRSYPNTCLILSRPCLF
jgi:hypothetical protein